MESLALMVATILGLVFGSGMLALGLSWSRKRWLRIASMAAASVSILCGLMIAGQLFAGNGILIGSIPVALGVFAFINLYRHKGKRE